MSNRFALPRILALSVVAGLTLSATCWAQPQTVPAKPETVPMKPQTVPMKKDQPAADAAAQPDPKAEMRRLGDLLDNFIHYCYIDQRELAAANGQALLESGLSDEQFAGLVEDREAVAKRFADAVIKAQTKSDLEKVASALAQKYERGRLAHARDAAEITRNIKLLTGTQNERIFATDRLKFAGEYAMPQLLAALLDASDPVRQARVRSVVVEMSRQAILPLCTALPRLDPNNQEIVAGVLGDLVNPYPTSLPFLYELRESASNEHLRQTCDRAIQRIAGVVNAEIPVTTRFETLAVEYYNESKGLTSFPGEDVQLLWNYDPGAGLWATPIATPVFHEAMAMRMAERSLQHNPANTEALAAWIAANFSREIDTPANYDNPAYPATRRDAMYYAVAAGSQVSERVLARAIDDHDTPLARRAIAAIEKTAGASSMIAPAARRPLLESLGYPSRRVQYDAALAVGSAQPVNEFAGADRIVPTLASAIRDAAARYAVVLGENKSDQGAVMELLRGHGYNVLPPGTSLSEIAQPIAEAPGIDLIISQLPAAQTDALIQEVRSRPGLAATPVLALVSLQGYLELSKKYEDDTATTIARSGLSNEQVAAAADQLIERAVGGVITPDEARDYKLRSLAVLRDLAVSNNPVLKISYASGPLTTALGQNTGDLRVKIAEVLSYVNDRSVQVAIMDAAGAATDEEQITLLGYVADSAKRFGNMLEPRQIGGLVKLATGTGSDAQATAAAALMGALNLPNTDLVPLILGEEK